MCVISDYIAHNHNIEKNGLYAVNTVDPRELLNKDRLDIIAKWIYIDCKEKGASFGIEFYQQHIKAMTRNSMIEGGDTSKNVVDDFVNRFNELIDDIKEFGYRVDFLPVPVDKNMRIIDGAHRVATCLYFNKKVKIVKIPVDLRTHYDSDYFINNNLEEDYLELMVTKKLRKT